MRLRSGGLVLVGRSYPKCLVDVIDEARRAKDPSRVGYSTITVIPRPLVPLEPTQGDNKDSI